MILNALATNAKKENNNADLKKTRQARQRILALRGSTAFRQDRDQDSQRDLEMATSTLKEAEAEVASARAALNMNKQFLNYKRELRLIPNMQMHITIWD